MVKFGPLKFYCSHKSMHGLALKITVEVTNVHVIGFPFYFIISFYYATSIKDLGVNLSFGLCAYMCEEPSNDLDPHKFVNIKC